MNRTVMIVAVSLVMGCGAGLSAQDGTARLEANRDYQLHEFIMWGSEYLDLPVTYASTAWWQVRSPRRKIRFDKPIEMPRADVLAFLMSRIFPEDLAIVRVGKGAAAYYLVENLATPTLLRSHRRVVTEEELDELKDTFVLVLCVIRLRHVSVQQVQTQIQRLTMQATPYGNAIIPLPNDAVVVVDFAPRVYELRQAIRAIDKKPATGGPTQRERDLAALVAKLSARVEALTKAVATKTGAKEK